jgi:hypothetical protein
MKKAHIKSLNTQDNITQHLLDRTEKSHEETSLKVDDSLAKIREKH